MLVFHVFLRGVPGQIAGILRSPIHPMKCQLLSDFDAAQFIAGDAETSTRAFNTTMAQLIGKLLAGGKPEERVQALYLQALLPGWSHSIEDGGKYRICGADLECMGKLINVNSPAGAISGPTPAAEPLVKLALSSRDPNTIAAAIYACQGTRAGACGAISVADWAAVDADNAAVWLMMANDAFPSGNMFSCRQLAQSNLLNQNVLTKSERKIRREVVANSGKSLAEVANGYRVRYPGLGE